MAVTRKRCPGSIAAWRSFPSSALAGSWPTLAPRAGIAKRELGRLDEAEEDLRYAIRIAEELGDRQLPGWTWRALAKVAELRGDKAAAEEHWRRSKEAESRGRTRFFSTPVGGVDQVLQRFFGSTAQFTSK